eukprot:3334820-Pleurochrysis_carterae.AAC.1
MCIRDSPWAVRGAGGGRLVRLSRVAVWLLLALSRCCVEAWQNASKLAIFYVYPPSCLFLSARLSPAEKILSFCISIGACGDRARNSWMHLLRLMLGTALEPACPARNPRLDELRRGPQGRLYPSLAIGLWAGRRACF